MADCDNIIGVFREVRVKERIGGGTEHGCAASATRREAAPVADRYAWLGLVHSQSVVDYNPTIFMLLVCVGPFAAG